MAERQDEQLVRAIFDYRNGREAIALMNSTQQGSKERLMSEPALVGILLDLQRAQTPGLTMEDVIRDLKRRGQAEEE